MSMPSITLVRAPACHFCADALTALTHLARDMPVRIDVVDADTPTGIALVGRHRPAMFPLVLVDETFFSQGRLPRGKLRRLLASRQAVATP